jgi:phospholipase A-2-activating protein
MAGTSSFKLSVQLEGHTADVRSVASTQGSSSSDVLILSGSRDGTARVWGKAPNQANKRDLHCKFVLEGQAGFVNSCAWMREQDGSSIALSGGQDHLVNAYIIPQSGLSSSSALTPDFTLLGHDDNVCALDVFQGTNGYIVSGSWDKTARIWKNWECAAILAGHTQAVWAVLALSEDLVLTAAADKIVRLYSISKAAKEGEKSKPIATFAGNTDAVRGLVRLSEKTFASCGNDGNINIYPIIDPASANPQSPVQPIQTLSGHTSFVYSLSLLVSGDLISSGEDRSVRIWRNGSLHQTITIPAISVWSVTGMPNGDLACGSSDGSVRVFTTVEQKYADPDVLQAYDAAVSSQSLNKAQVGDVQKDSLPGAEALADPGKEGQVKMVRNGDLVEAHQYSSSSGQWVKIGEVVGGVGSSQKKLHDGKEYDYVFDVDIEDGAPPLKLPYNASENPYVAAQRFLEKNELPLGYLDQVVNFIEKNSGGVQLGGGDQFRDPYTGGTSYRPGGGAPAAVTQAPVASTPQASSTASSTTTILPHTIALTFKQFNVQGARSKIAELNAQLPADVAFSAQESSVVEDILSKLSQSQFAIGVDQVNSLQNIIERWPITHRFPLVDIYRLVSIQTSTNAAEVAEFSLKAAQWNESWPLSPAEAKGRVTLSLLALRAIANALSVSNDVDNSSKALALLDQASHFEELSKPGKTAYATVLLNASIALVKVEEKGKQSLATQILPLINNVIETESRSSDRDTETIYRSEMGFGNLIISSAAGSLKVIEVQKVLQTIKTASAAVNEARIQSLLKEIESKSGFM